MSLSQIFSTQLLLSIYIFPLFWLVFFNLGILNLPYQTEMEAVWNISHKVMDESAVQH